MKTITAVDIDTVDSNQLLRNLTSLPTPFLGSYQDHHDPHCFFDQGSNRTLPPLFKTSRKIRKTLRPSDKFLRRDCIIMPVDSWSSLVISSRLHCLETEVENFNSLVADLSSDLISDVIKVKRATWKQHSHHGSAGYHRNTATDLIFLNQKTKNSRAVLAI